MRSKPWAVALAIVLLAALAVPASAASEVDFVFLIDATGSMTGEIAGVRNGFSSFVSGLGANIDARYSIIVFGGAAELVLDLTSDATLTQTRLNQIIIGANAGVHNDHNVNPEAGLEAIRMALGASALVNNNIPQDGILDFRPDARINMILATDEDSDLPFYLANRFPNQSGNEPPSVFNAIWQAEVDATAAMVIQNEVFLNMLVGTDTPTYSQYGDWHQDVSDANLLNYDAAATLTNLINAGYGDSLQAQVLAAGLVARTFSVQGANNPTFVDNFFAAKIQEVQQDVVPEPGTIALFGVGLLGIGFYRRRRRSA